MRTYTIGSNTYRGGGVKSNYDAEGVSPRVRK